MADDHDDEVLTAAAIVLLSNRLLSNLLLPARVCRKEMGSKCRCASDR